MGFVFHSFFNLHEFLEQPLQKNRRVHDLQINLRHIKNMEMVCCVVVSAVIRTAVGYLVLNIDRNVMEQQCHQNNMQSSQPPWHQCYYFEGIMNERMMGHALVGSIGRYIPCVLPLLPRSTIQRYRALLQYQHLRHSCALHGVDFYLGPVFHILSS